MQFKKVYFIKKHGATINLGHAAKWCLVFFPTVTFLNFNLEDKQNYFLKKLLREQAQAFKILNSKWTHTHRFLELKRC